MQDGNYARLDAPQDESDGRCLVQFRMHPVNDETASKEQGRPIFSDTEYIKIMVPGDKECIVDTPVTDIHKQRFAKAYAKWKEGKQTELGDGTPLDAWPGVTRSQVEELRYFGVRTVEALAKLSDSNVQNIGPILALRKRAQDYLAAAAGEAPVVKMRGELEKRDAELDNLKRQLKEQGDRIDQMTKSGQNQNQKPTR